MYFRDETLLNTGLSNWIKYGSFMNQQLFLCVTLSYSDSFIIMEVRIDDYETKIVIKKSMSVNNNNSFVLH